MDDSKQMIVPPVFIKATVSFNLLGKDYVLKDLSVSTFGVSAIRWSKFDPVEKVGMEIPLVVQVNTSEKFRFSTLGFITAEQTTDAKYLGMRFQLNSSDKSRLSSAIAREGFHPTNYIRKFPRIPASGDISSMPLRAILKASDDLISFDIVNLSPNGILLKTENAKAALLRPPQRITVQVEPRGTSYRAFEFEGMICRTLFDRNLESKNIVRSFGVRFLSLADADRIIFFDVLKNVLNAIDK